METNKHELGVYFLHKNGRFWALKRTLNLHESDTNNWNDQDFVLDYWRFKVSMSFLGLKKSCEFLLKLQKNGKRAKKKEGKLKKT